MYDFQPTLDAVAFYIQVAAIAKLTEPIFVFGGIFALGYGLFRIGRYFDEH